MLISIDVDFGTIAAQCDCGWSAEERTICRPHAWRSLEERWILHAGDAHGMSERAAAAEWRWCVDIGDAGAPLKAESE